MGKNIFWKSVVRRKGSLFLFLALLIIASFGFVLRTVEYLSVSREIVRISENYRPIGIFSDGESGSENTSAESSTILKGIDILEESPYLDFVNRRRYCAAILSDIYNSDLDGLTSDREKGLGVGIRNNDILAWARLEDIKATGNADVFRYDFRVMEPVYGYPDYLSHEKKIVAYFNQSLLGGSGENIPERGKTYLIKGYYVAEKNTGRGDVLTFGLLPLEENLYLLEETADRSVAQQYVDADAGLQERNRHAMSVTAVTDMSLLPDVQDSVQTLHLEEGRWLDRIDNAEGKNVCVVSKKFAEARGLQVGDVLSMKLQDWNSIFMGYVSDVDMDTWKNCEETEVALEIVGLYSWFFGGMAGSPDFETANYYDNYLFIPDRLLPEHYLENEPFTSDAFSFVLKSPKYTEAFETETGEKLEALGLSHSFVENNWERYYVSATGIARGARWNFILFSIVMVIALAVVAFLYSWQRKKEMAIARAAGVPKKDVVIGACLPLLCMGAASILAGSAFAWKYGLKQANETLAEIASGGRAELSLAWFAGICLLLWFALSFILLTGTLLYANKPVLELLQGNPVRGQKKAADVQESPSVEEQPSGQTMKPVAVPGVFLAKKKSVYPAMAGFVMHHLFHISLRPVCVIAVACVFVTASGWLRESILGGEERLDELYCNTTVEAGITKANEKVFASLEESAGAYIYDITVRRIMDTGFVEQFYLEAGLRTRMGKQDKSTGMKKMMFLGVNDIGKFLDRDWGIEPEIRYGEGYGAELFGQECIQADDGTVENMFSVIVPESVWEKWNLHPGDGLSIADSRDHLILDVEAGGYYSGELEGFFEDTVLVPLSLLEELESNLSYFTAEFVLDAKMNRDLPEFLEKARHASESNDAGAVGLKFILWDDELRQVVEPMEKNINLMKLLYPIANIVSFLIAAGLAVLLLFQRRHEAAILRVLGVGAAPVRVSLAVELLILDIVGVLLGLGATYAITHTADLLSMGIAACTYFAGGVIGALAGCILITKERPLELLQVKE